MTVYLIHLARPYHHARHYLGCTHDLTNRVAMHRKRTGAKLLRAVSRAGIPFDVMRPYKDKSGVDRQSIDIVANTVQLLDKKQNGSAAVPAADAGVDPFLPEFPDE